MPVPLVLLHGFAGTHRAWDAVRAHLPAERYRPVVAPDLPGHGRRGRQRPIDFAACVQAVVEEAPAGRFVLAGYSLGGRVAQHVACANPERIARLVLVSTTAGIDDRAARAERDDAFAARIATMSRERFATAWQSLPVFAGTPEHLLAAWRTDLMRNAPADLAVALAALSPGRMEPLWERLAEVALPTTVIVGERDERYRRFARRYRGADVVVVPGAGHGLVREAPAELAALL